MATADLRPSRRGERTRQTLLDAAEKLFAEKGFYGVTVRAIAREAIKRNVGARGLRIIMEELMLDLMFSIPSQPDVKEAVITEEVVHNQVQPMLLYQQQAG